ncbi:MAG: pentapeptide repeat-containing protein [Candidatus Krumholzibacteria bacterium]|nr:pentapeptide repeat-containing protein [Candidatus Krumholzibacteria bacterium]
MPSEKPVITKDPMYQLLRVDNVKAFNIKKEAGQTCELRGVNLRALDLRGLNADGLDFTDSYFRDADLRGIDFSQSILQGTSLRGAHFSGCLFPPELSPEEIRLSYDLGTRMRYKK